MSRVYKRVTPAEIASLMREVSRVLELGSLATAEELDRVRAWKIDILDRIAMDPGPFDDPAEAAEVSGLAQRGATALRLGLPGSGG